MPVLKHCISQIAHFQDHKSHLISSGLNWVSESLSGSTVIICHQTLLLFHLEVMAICFNVVHIKVLNPKSSAIVLMSQVSFSYYQNFETRTPPYPVIF